MTLAFVKHTYYNNAAFKGGHTISLMCLFSSSLIILSSAAGNFLGGRGGDGNDVGNDRSGFAVLLILRDYSISI